MHCDPSSKAREPSAWWHLGGILTDAMHDVTLLIAGEADACGGLRAAEGHRLAREHDRERLQQRAIHQQCRLGPRLRGCSGSS